MFSMVGFAMLLGDVAVGVLVCAIVALLLCFVTVLLSDFLSLEGLLVLSVRFLRPDKSCISGACSPRRRRL